ncbi:MAG: hypothetical protein ABJG78_16660 [Cyclobacteriaceae bacterium]
MQEKDIPEEFFSFETKAPFERCLECDKYLLDGDTEYLIEKAIKNYHGFKARDVIFDFAICMDCMLERSKEISPESASKIAEYFQQNVDLERRLALSEENPEANLDRCMIKGTEVDSCSEYQICGYFKGTKMNLNNPPYLISGEVMEELMPLLSDKTIDEMNGFFNKHFSPDPSFFEPTPKLILV